MAFRTVLALIVLVLLAVQSSDAGEAKGKPVKIVGEVEVFFLDDEATEIDEAVLVTEDENEIIIKLDEIGKKLIKEMRGKKVEVEGLLEEKTEGEGEDEVTLRYITVKKYKEHKTK